MPSIILIILRIIIIHNVTFYFYYYFTKDSFFSIFLKLFQIFSFPQSSTDSFYHLFQKLKTHCFIFFCEFTYFNCRLITLQYCSSFCHALTWISHGCTCVPHPEPPPTSLPIPSLCVIPVHQPWAPCLMHRTWIGSNIHITMTLYARQQKRHRCKALLHFLQKR